MNKTNKAVSDALELPAYRVIFADGTSYITNMSKATTLEKARAYFIDASLEQPDGSCKRVADVQPETGEGDPAVAGQGAPLPWEVSARFNELEAQVALKNARQDVKWVEEQRDEARRQRDELLAVCKQLVAFTYTDYQPQVALQILVRIKRQARLAMQSSQESRHLAGSTQEGSAQ